ncbi:MAG: 2OG-Fe dioxygenase family protein [Cyanobacteria bacterium J06642_11]
MQISKLLPQPGEENIFSQTKTAFTRPLLTTLETTELLASCGPLGPDPSSEHFIKRTKSIAYVMKIAGQWFQLKADYFSQPEQYNDFSGGYKRVYQELPSTFLGCLATQKVLNTFQLAYEIPERELVLVQIQTSHIDHENMHQCLTGQGIHSDGADRAILVCLQRDNITHAENALYCDLEGQQPMLSPFVLQEGQAMLWHDNQVFHWVAPARLDCPHRSGRRTVLIAHYPAFHYLSGQTNPNNRLGTHLVSANKRLRLSR